MEEEPDYYEILQVHSKADPEVIDAAYRRLARKYHPDSGNPEASEELMKQLNAAYEVISNPALRLKYDERRKLLDDFKRQQLEAEQRKRTEQAALIEGLVRMIAQQGTARQSVTMPGRLTLRELDGSAVIRSWDGTYLGLISSDQYEADSISNPYGPYGNPYSPTSIRNKYGQYGGRYSIYSPFNPNTTTPPVVVHKGQAIAYLTVSSYLKPSINPNELLTQLG